MVAALYLPSLNADIIDNGVATGDTGYIVRTGAVMLAVVAAADRLLGHGGLVRRAYGDGLRPRRPRRDLPPGRHLLPARGAALRRALADHPRDQRRPAGADARADGLHARGLLADHDGRRRDHGAARGRRPRLDPGRRGAGAVPLGRPHGQPDGAELPADAGAHRRGQPAAARADHRHPRGPRVRPRAPRDRALRHRQRRPHRGRGPGRSLDGHDVPAGDAGRERLERRRHLVRRPPRRQRRRCRSAR